jgi:hypothetical protein
MEITSTVEPVQDGGIPEGGLDRRTSCPGMAFTTTLWAQW